MKLGGAGLTSLTDIVSNAVGILVLFAMLGLVHQGTKTYTVEVPIEKERTLAPVFFYCSGDGIAAVNIDALFRSGIEVSARGGEAKEFAVADADEQVRFSAEFTERLGLRIRARGSWGWERPSGLREGGDAARWETDQSPLRTSFEALERNREREFAFFFVDMGGERAAHAVETYRSAREWLARRGVRTGWMPVDQDNPAYICVWADVPECRYRSSEH